MENMRNRLRGGLLFFSLRGDFYKTVEDLRQQIRGFRLSKCSVFFTYAERFVIIGAMIAICLRHNELEQALKKEAERS